MPAADRHHESVQELVDSGALKAMLAGAFTHLSPEARDGIGALLQCARFSLQTQRELIEWLPEIACAEGCTVREVLLCPEADAVRDPRAPNRPQAIEKLRGALRTRRFPRLEAMRKHWEQDVRSANPDPGRVAFVAPEAFERDGVEVRLAIADEHEAARLLRGLSAIPPELWRRITCPAAQDPGQVGDTPKGSRPCG